MPSEKHNAAFQDAFANPAYFAQSFFENEALLRSVGETMDYGVWLCDRSGANLYVSPSFLSMTGLDPDTCRDKGWQSLCHEDDVASMTLAWRDAVRKKGRWSVECRVRGLNGNYYPALIRGRAVRSDKGKIICWSGLILDISGVRKNEEYLKKVDRRKDEFLATLGHEIRNLLAPIRNGINVLSATPGQSNICVEVNKVVARQVDQLTRLVDDLLDISRIKSHKIEIRKEQVNLVEVVSEAIDLARPAMEGRGHKLTVGPLPKQAFVDADAARLLQVFCNLLNNAAKYTPDGGDIKVGMTAADGKAVVSVQDNGLGIAPDVLPTIFDMYAQGQYSSERAQGGLGVGLTLVKTLVDRHGGEVQAFSDGVNRGSVFNVSLPLSHHEQKKVKKMEKAAIQQPNSAALRILVVDDNEASAKTLTWTLELMGHDVHYACTPVSAMEAAKRFIPHAVMMDIGMPEMNGYDLCRLMQGVPELKDTVFIAQTGWTQARHQLLSREAGFRHHLIKPITNVVLKDVLQGISAMPQS
jgi:PAS domain S-box-containing protein